MRRLWRLGLTTLRHSPMPAQRPPCRSVLRRQQAICSSTTFGRRRSTTSSSIRLNDTFTFLLNGLGVTDENIALIPGASDPVEIDTVNNLVNSEFYNDNDAAAGSPFDIEYDGFTDVFTASATGLTSGAVYAIDLIVSDTGVHPTTLQSSSKATRSGA
ncbi:MAG: choice-of-anchor L domain-containing protein [Rhodobacteraceae bacterium]|nr:choice-of-anchor L domain-containing protein [Paracoccaceae bacterium]